MFFRRNPAGRLRRAYERKLKEALAAQRRGKIEAYAELTAEAEAIRKELERMETQ